MADEIQVEYNLNTKQAQESLNKLTKEFVTLGTTGGKVLIGWEETANGLVPKFEKVRQAAEKTGRQFNGLANSINQVSRELPNFAVSANVGILALSNNLPILFDELLRVKQINAELTAQGQMSVPVWKQIGQAVFSLSGILSLAVTAFTILGPKIIQFITSSEDSAEAVKKEAAALKARNDELQRQQDLQNDLNKNIKSNIEAELQRRAASQGGLNEQKQTLELLKARGATEKEIFDQQQIIRQIELDNLKTIQNNLEVSAFETLEIAVAIQNKENEIKAAGLKYQADVDEKAAKEAEKARKKREKEQKEEEKRRLEQLRMFAEAETRLAALRVDNARQAFKNIGVYYKGEIEYIESLQKALINESKDETKTIKRREEILKQGLENGLITQAQYAEASKDIERTKRDAIVGLASETANTIGSIAQIVGQQSEAGKSLAIAQTLIDTYLAAQRSYTAAAILGPIAGAAAATLATIAGLGRVAQIQAVTIPQPPPVQATYFKSGNEFAEGIVDLQGPGTATSDDIPAWLSKGESVIKARSTAAKKDELKALNYSVMDYDKLIQDKYVKPALEAQKKEQQAFAENVARSIAIHNEFNSRSIVKAINKNKPADKKDFEKLSQSISRSQRKERFLKKHGI